MEFLIPARQSVSKLHTSGGYLLLEAVISMAIFSGLLFFFTLSFRNVFTSQTTSAERVEAGLYAQEGMEVMYNLAINTTDWNGFVANFDPDKTYYPVFSTVAQLAEGEEVIKEKYTRKIFVQTVFRDPVTHQIVPDGTGGAVEDPGTLRIVTLVTWNVNGSPQEVKYETYVVEKGQ